MGVRCRALFTACARLPPTSLHVGIFSVELQPSVSQRVLRVGKCLQEQTPTSETGCELSPLQRTHDLSRVTHLLPQPHLSCYDRDGVHFDDQQDAVEDETGENWIHVRHRLMTRIMNPGFMTVLPFGRSSSKLRVRHAVEAFWAVRDASRPPRWRWHVGRKPNTTPTELSSTLASLASYPTGLGGISQSMSDGDN